MNSSSFMQEEDLLNTILADLKRTVREYVTAATEANCDTVRQMFTDLTNSTLRMQGDLYHLLKQQNMYTLSAPTSRKSVEQALQQNQQSKQKCQQFIQQKLGNAQPSILQFQSQPTHTTTSQDQSYM